MIPFRKFLFQIRKIRFKLCILRMRYADLKTLRINPQDSEGIITLKKKNSFGGSRHAFQNSEGKSHTQDFLLICDDNIFQKIHKTT